MIRINRETDYGIGILTLMARGGERRYNATTLAELRGLPRPMVSKILKQLAREGLLHSFRGAKGGYGLARAPAEITVAEIIVALEGPIALTDCIEVGRDGCQYGSNCTVSTNWARINDVVRQALEHITLAEMSVPIVPTEHTGTAFPLDFTGVRHVSDH